MHEEVRDVDGAFAVQTRWKIRFDENSADISLKFLSMYPLTFYGQVISKIFPSEDYVSEIPCEHVFNIILLYFRARVPKRSTKYRMEHVWEDSNIITARSLNGNQNTSEESPEIQVIRLTIPTPVQML